MTADLERRFRRFIQHHRLVQSGDRVLVALSGGIDSVVLLHLLQTQREELGISLHAAHFDHGMRPDSTADADWVAGFCSAWGMPLTLARTTRPLYGEADARLERYRFLQQTQQLTGARVIATAHHADDQVETVLFRLLRGTGLRGLAGIPVRRGNVIRPLLRFSKAQLAGYAREHALAFREDPTNEQLAYTRNRIRHAVIPVLEGVNANAKRAILQLARQAARSERAWHSLLRRVIQQVVIASDTDSIQLARAVLLEYDAEIRLRVLRQLLRRFDVVPTRRASRRLLEFCSTAASGSSLDMPNRVRVVRAFDELRIERARNITRSANTPLRIAGPQDGAAELVLDGARYHAAWQLNGEFETPRERFAADDLIFPLELRAWQPGDRMRLPYGSKKLKKLFAERRLSRAQRARVPVLVDATGRVLWVVGVARSTVAVPKTDGRTFTLTVRNVEVV